MFFIVLCISPDTWTAIFTGALAVLTFYIFKYARKAFEESVNANKENAKQNHLQDTKNTVFKLLEFHYNILNGIEVNRVEAYFDEGSNSYTLNLSKPSSLVNGVAAIKSIYEDLKITYSIQDNKAKLDAIHGKRIGDGVAPDDRTEEIIKASFYEIYLKYNQIGNYFKNLYFLIRFISEKSKNIDGLDDLEYIGLIKAQLSKYEILLLTYNCIWINGETDKKQDEEFIEYAKKYKILSALETDELISSDHIDLISNYN